MDIFFLIIGLVAGVAVGFLFAKTKYGSSNGSVDNEKLHALEKQKDELLSEKGQLTGNLEKSREFFKQQQEELVKLQQDNNILTKELAEYKTKHTELKEETQKLQEKFQTEFENIANKLLKQNSTEFTESNQKKLEGILNPFKEKIEKFEKQVQETYEKELKQTTSLKAEVKQLFELNQKLSEDAQNLTKALKGDVKKQGNWGEIILEKVLESSGLEKGREYTTQTTSSNTAGDTIRPDVIVNLPDNKHIIIDSKVSLLAYNNYISATDETEKNKFLAEHLISIKAHIKTLSSKEYHSSLDFNTPDFVLLFMPIEASFSLAMENDKDLFVSAWDKKIVIVTPTTLLATLRTVSSLWKQEKQTKNALEIARQSGNLYDKFMAFLDDLEKIQKGIESSQKAYEGAFNKLKSGKGNLISRVEKIKELGIKTEKNLPSSFEDFEDSDDEGELPKSLFNE